MIKSKAPAGIVLEPPQGTKTDTFRLGYIDGLRAVAMLMVLICHGWVGFFYTVHVPLFGRTWELAHVQEAGYFGIDFFLIILGFCLFFPYAGDAARPEPTLSQFFLKRIRRIVPPYYAVAMICVVAAWFRCLPPPNAVYTHRYLLHWLACHALLMHNLFYHYLGTLNVTMWSMGLEWQLYLFFPLLFVAYRRWNPRWTFLIVLILNGAFLQYLKTHAVMTEEVEYVLGYSVFGRVFEFALGMFVASLMAQQRRLGCSPLQPVDWLFLAASVLEAVWDTRREVLRGLSVDFLLSYLPKLAWAICCGAVLFFAGRPGTLNRALSWPPLMRLGLFSYSIYLIQGAILVPLCAFFKPLLHSALLQFMAEWLLIVPLVITVSYVFHLAFERPYMSLPPGDRRPLTLARVFLPHLEKPISSWAALCAGTCALILGMMTVMARHAAVHRMLESTLHRI